MFTRSFTHYRGGGAHFIESPSNVLIITLLFFNPIINDIKLLFIIALNEVIFCEKKIYIMKFVAINYFPSENND